MQQTTSELAQSGALPNPVDRRGLCLLSLDGGGVRGLSSLYILKSVMDQLNDERQNLELPPVKPCEVFDLIGGTSTGGLIAIMLGRLEMDVDQCIDEYSALAAKVFGEKRSSLPFTWRGKVNSKFSSKKLEDAIVEVLEKYGCSRDTKFNDGVERGCRTFVCTTDRITKDIVHLRSYKHREQEIPSTIHLAALATSAAPSFFDAIDIGDFSFADGGLGANNPVDEVEREATDIWADQSRKLMPQVKCFISIGTGNPGIDPFKDSVYGFLKDTLAQIATDTEKTERNFTFRWANELDGKRYFRFNVEQGLQTIGLEEHNKRKEMNAATQSYLNHPNQKLSLRYCTQNLSLKENKTETAFEALVDEHYIGTIRGQSKQMRSFYLPFLQNRQFVGRSAELETLRQRLLISKNCQKIAISGLGGIGKTQVALQFAYSVKQSCPEYSIFWVQASSMEAFEQGCMKMASALGIQQGQESNEDVKKLVQECLSAKAAEKWLLIVDNADDLGLTEGLLAFLPESDGGLTIFTTRHRAVAQHLTGSDVIEIGKMTAKETGNLMDNSLVQKSPSDDYEIVMELLTELDYLPLAITQAAAYINTNESSISEYLHLLKNTEQDVFTLMSTDSGDKTRYQNLTNAVAKTWMVTFNKILEHDALAADLLAFISCIEWKAIPRSMLPTVHPEAQLAGAIGTLCSYSFLERRDDGKKFDMHRLVHLATRIWIRQKGYEAGTSRAVLKHLSVVFPSDDYKYRETWRDYLPHAAHIHKDEQCQDTEENSNLCFKVGRCLYGDGRTKEAVLWLQECCEWRKRNRAQNNPGRLSSQHMLAVAYLANGQIKEAVKLLDHIVKIKAEILPEDNRDKLASQHELAAAYLANGQIKKAVNLLQQVVQIQTEILAEDHPDKLASQHELASAYLADGQIKEAVNLLQHVVKMRTVLAEDHPRRLASQHELARAYKANGQVNEAMKLLEHIIKIQTEILSEDHPNRLAAQHELARAYEANGQIKKAVTLLEHVVKISTMFAEHHPDRLASQHQLAGAYLASGQTKKAVTLLEYVVKINTVLPEDHPNRLAAQHELARAYIVDKQAKKAVALLEHVMKMRAGFAEDHPDRLASQQVLAGAYLAVGQIKKAVVLLEHVVTIRTVLAEHHPYRLAAQHELARAYLADKQAKEAVKLLKHVVKIQEVLAEDHPNQLVSQHELARAYYADGQIEEAVELLEHVVKIQKVLAENHPDRLISERTLDTFRKTLSERSKTKYRFGIF